MNTLADTLAQHNLTTEDIEKAASVRIFAKVAAAENIDLSQLTEPQIDELYAHFEANVLPGILSGNAAEPSTTNHTSEPVAAPKPNEVLPCP